MSSPHLEAERARLLQLIQSIHNSGSVAPITVWISPAPKVEHLYYKLSSKNPQYKNQHLGKAGSEKYLDWRMRIQRREATLAVSAKQRAELEQQLSLLQALIDRQASVSIAVPDREGTAN